MTYISIALGLVCLGVSSTPMGSQYDSLRGAPGAVDQLLMLAGVALLDAAGWLAHRGKKNKNAKQKHAGEESFPSRRFCQQAAYLE